MNSAFRRMNSAFRRTVKRTRPTLGPDWKRIQNRQTQNGEVMVPVDVMTRQRQRALIRKGSFDQLTQKYGGEPRDRRRAMALSSAQRTYRIAADQLREKRKPA